METGRNESGSEIPNSDEARLLNEVLEGVTWEDIASKIQAGTFNEFQKANLSKMLESLKGTYVAIPPQGNSDIVKVTKEGYQIALINQKGECVVMDYIGLAESLEVGKDDLGNFLSQAGYSFPPSQLGSPGQPRKSPPEFLATVGIISQ